MKVTREQALALFAALGYGTASKWNNKRMEAKLNKIDRSVEEDTQLEGEPQQTLTKIKEALANKETIGIGGEEAPTEEAQTEETPPVEEESPTEESPTEETKTEEENENVAKKTKTKAKKAPAKKKEVKKAPGVIASIVEFLEAGKAMTKEQILNRLVKRFPDREPSALIQTINCQVPTRLRKEKKLKITKTFDGYLLKK